MQTVDLRSQNETESPAVALPAYVPPAVTTYTDEQLLEALGPAQAGAYTAPT